MADCTPRAVTVNLALAVAPVVVTYDGSTAPPTGPGRYSVVATVADPNFRGGMLSTEPVRGGAAISLVNAGLEGFARGAALEQPRGVGGIVVSPPWVSETSEEMGQAPSKGTPAAQVAAAYVESVEGRRNGETSDARNFGMS